MKDIQFLAFWTTETVFQKSELGSALVFHCMERLREEWKVILIFWLKQAQRIRSCGGKLLGSVTALVCLSCPYITIQPETDAILRGALSGYASSPLCKNAWGRGECGPTCNSHSGCQSTNAGVELHWLKGNTWASGGLGNTRPSSITEQWAGWAAWPPEEYSEMGKLPPTPASHCPKHKTEEALGSGSPLPLKRQVRLRRHVYQCSFTNTWVPHISE